VEPPAPEPDRSPSPEAGATRPAGPLACSKCGSLEVIPSVRIVDYGESDWKRDLHVEVCENPDALIFKGTHRGSLRAMICGRCGYAELYVSNPQELLAAYKRSWNAQ
jgi:hypothetical protein